MQLGPKLDVTSLVARDKQMTKELEINFDGKIHIFYSFTTPNSFISSYMVVTDSANSAP